MLNSPIKTITDFLHQSPHTPLLITFATLEICSHQNGQLLRTVQRQQSRIILQKISRKGLAEITVLDNLVFSFSFQIQIPSAQKFHEVEMLSLPRPLDQGRWCMDDEKLQISFRIDAPGPFPSGAYHASVPRYPSLGTPADNALRATTVERDRFNRQSPYPFFRS